MRTEWHAPGDITMELRLKEVQSVKKKKKKKCGFE